MVQPDRVFFPPRRALTWHRYSKDMMWDTDVARFSSLSLAYICMTCGPRMSVTGYLDGIAAM